MPLQCPELNVQQRGEAALGGNTTTDAAFVGAPLGGERRGVGNRAQGLILCPAAEDGAEGGQWHGQGGQL